MTNLNINTVSIELSKNQLKAFLKVMPKKDIRYYLNGLAILKGSDSLDYLCATDGRILLVAGIAKQPGLRENIIIPEPVINLAVKANQKYYVITESKVSGIDYEPVRGQFPSISRAIPTIEEQKPANLNAKLLHSLSESVALYANTKIETVYTVQNGIDASIVRCGSGSVFGVIMPKKDNEESDVLMPVKL